MSQCLVTVATSPPQVFSGLGMTREAAEDDAAQGALTALTAECCIEQQQAMSLVPNC